LVERFWTVEAEDGTASSFKTLIGTMVVATTVSVSLASPAVSEWMFRYPETLGIVLAAQILLGRYTGYRLTELYRFGDLLEEERAVSHDAHAERAAATNGAANHNGAAPGRAVAEREEIS
jgi:hypothetical protein